MPKLRARTPSPALVISLIALFVALGGSAYAVKKVGTGDIRGSAITTGKIKKNAVTAGKIKRNAVTTPKLRNNAVTGAKIDEGSLGPVPSATTATNAINAANFSRYFTSGLRKANLGETIILASLGPFTMFGRCEDKGAGVYRATTLLTTSQPKSFLHAYNSSYGAFDFEPGIEAELGEYANAAGPYWIGENGVVSGWSAISPDGSVVLQGFANNGVHAFGSPCSYNLTWTDNA